MIEEMTDVIMIEEIAEMIEEVAEVETEVEAEEIEAVAVETEVEEQEDKEASGHELRAVRNEICCWRALCSQLKAKS